MWFERDKSLLRVIKSVLNNQNMEQNKENIFHYSDLDTLYNIYKNGNLERENFINLRNYLVALPGFDEHKILKEQPDVVFEQHNAIQLHLKEHYYEIVGI